jgi:hypothetical protein
MKISGMMRMMKRKTPTPMSDITQDQIDADFDLKSGGRAPLDEERALKLIGTPYQGTGKPYRQGACEASLIRTLIKTLAPTGYFYDPTNQVFAPSDSGMTITELYTDDKGVEKKRSYPDWRSLDTLVNVSDMSKGRVWLKRDEGEYCVIIS